MKKYHRVKLTQEQVEAIFEQATKQEDYLLGLFALVIPDLDRVEKVDGFPECSEATANEICKLCIAWDKKHAPHVMSGGAWLNYGFSTCSNEAKACKLWEVQIDLSLVSYRPAVTVIPMEVSHAL